MSRPQDRTLGTNSLPAGPLAAGTTSFTNTAQLAAQFSTVYQQYLNDAVRTTALETHTPALTVSPAWSFTTQPVPRQGRRPERPLPEFEFTGLERFTAFDTVGAVPSRRASFRNTIRRLFPRQQTGPSPLPTILRLLRKLDYPFSQHFATS